MLKSVSGRHISVIASIALIGTLGMSGCSSSGGSSDTEVVASTISGTISDGPVYDSTVVITDATTGATLGTVDKTSKTTGAIGNYSIDLSNMTGPIMIEATGGIDTGADGIINANDRSSTGKIKTVAEKPAEGVAVVANATPATTLIAEVVEDQITAGETPSVDTASQVIVKAFNLPTGTDLIKSNPKTDKIAAKAASFVANAIDSMPEGVDTAATYQAFKNIVKKSSTDNKPLATITGTTMSIDDDFSVTDIANDMIENNADAISYSDIQKLEKSEDTIKAQIQSAAEKSKPVDTMTAAEQIEAVSADQTLDVLNNAIAEVSDVSALDTTMLNKLMVVTEKTISSIMESAATEGESGIDAIDSSNLATLATVLQDNLSSFEVDTDGALDFTTSTISLTTLGNVAEKAQDMAAEIATATTDSAENAEVANNIMENMFASLDLTNVESLSSLDNIDVADIVEISESIIEKSAELITDANAEDSFLESMADVVAASISAGESDFTEIAKNTVENNTLTSAIETLSEEKSVIEAKIEALVEGETLTAADLGAILASDTITDTIVENFADKDFVFNTAVADNFDTMQDTMQESLSEAITSTATGEDIDILENIMAVETTASLVDITADDFSADSFESVEAQINDIIDANNDGGGDIGDALDVFTENVEELIESGTSLDDAISQEAENIADYIDEVIDVVDPTDPVVDPTDPVVDPTDPVIDPTDPVIDPTDPVVDPITCETGFTLTDGACVADAVTTCETGFTLTDGACVADGGGGGGDGTTYKTCESGVIVVSTATCTTTATIPEGNFTTLSGSATMANNYALTVTDVLGDSSEDFTVNRTHITLLDESTTVATNYAAIKTALDNTSYLNLDLELTANNSAGAPVDLKAVVIISTQNDYIIATVPAQFSNDAGQMSVTVSGDLNLTANIDNSPLSLITTNQTNNMVTSTGNNLDFNIFNIIDKFSSNSEFNPVKSFMVDYTTNSGAYDAYLLLEAADGTNLVGNSTQDLSQFGLGNRKAVYVGVTVD